MRHIPPRVLAAGLLALSATPVAAEGILSKARYAHPLVASSLPAGALTGAALAAAAPLGDSAPGAAAGAAAGSVAGMTVEAVDATGIVVGPGSVPGPDGLADLPLLAPGATGGAGIDPGALVITTFLPAGGPGDGMPVGIECGVPVPMAGATGPMPMPPGGPGVPAPGAAGGAVIVAGKPTPAALLKAANAAAAANASTAGSGQPVGLAQQIRDQVRQATGGRTFRPGSGRTIGASTATFGTPVDAKPLVLAGTAPGAPPRSAGPASGLPRFRPLVVEGGDAALPLQAPGNAPTATPAASLRVPAAGGTAAAGNAAAQAGVSAAVGITGARAVAPASTAPRWRDRISFATPLGR